MYMANAKIVRLATYIPLTCVRVWQILGLALGIMQILAFLNTNMLVYPKRNCGVEGLSQCKDPMRMVLRRSGI